MVIPELARDGPVGFAVVRAAKAHKAVSAALLRQVGLYPGQELLLMHLHDRDHRGQTELAWALDLDTSTVTRMVARLEQQGIVSRRANPSDGRALVVSLTPRGRCLCSEVRRIWTELEELCTRDLSARQCATLARGLRRVGARLAPR